MSNDAPASEGDDGEFSLTTEQEDALEFGHNISITAGAGTGKTTTLKERYRAILRENPECSPENVLTLTFTKDATSEMQDRIREVVAEELAAADDDTYPRWRRAKDDVEDAYIHTIHGFCSRVLREFAVETSVHPEFETLDEGEAGSVISDAITAVLDRNSVEDDFAEDAGRLADADMPEGDWDLYDELATLTQLYSRSSLESALESLFSERPESTEWANRWADASPDEYLAYLSQHVDVSITQAEATELMQQDAVQELIAELQTLSDTATAIPLDDNGRALLEELTSFLDDTKAHTTTGSAVDRQRFLLMVADGVTTGAGTRQSQTWRYAGSKGTWSEHGFEDERERLEDALDGLADIIEPETRNLDHDPLEALNGAAQAIALARVFQATRAEYERLKRRRNALDYSDLISKAAEFLSAHDPARRELSDQFTYIMVDEVQDTDPRQWQLVKLLSGDDPERFDGRNVFLVGDEKQSIYRFRDADVTQFRDARNTLIDDNPAGVDGNLELTGNFRTVENTLSVINELFEEVLQPAARETETGGIAGSSCEAEPDPTGGVPHESYEAAPQSLDALRTEGAAIDGSVEYLVVPDDEDADNAFGLANAWFTDAEFVSRAEREAKAVAARLTQLFESGPNIYDPDSETYTTPEPRHVALLFRSSRRLAAFERALEGHDIPYTNLASSGFYNTPEVLPLVNLLKVFEDPTAEIPLYGVLRSPLFGFTDSTIATAREPDANLWDSLQSADPELQRARRQINDWRTSIGLGDGRTVNQWSGLVSRIIDETGYLVSIGADDRPQQAVANVEKFREQLRNWEEANARSVTDLIDRIKQTRESTDDPGEATVPGEVDGVQLRTIHSAKGLEWPIVCIPELTRNFNLRSSITSAHLERIDGDPILGIKAPTAESAYDVTNTATYLHVREQYRRLERAEQRRVLYVAATRCRDHLLLSGTHSTDAETESGLDAAGNWDEAKCWADWVQPVLLTESGLVNHLAENDDLSLSIGNGEYTVRRPTPPSDWEPPTDEQTIPTDIEIPAPDRAKPRARLSATQFRDRLEDAPNRPPSLRFTNMVQTEPAGNSDSESVESLQGDVVGTVVHKLCEITPPKADWPAIIRRCVDNPDALTQSAIEQITRHAEAGIEELATLEADHTVTSRHSELTVELDLEHAHVVGDIDHLSVTEHGYLIADYKTSNLETQSIEALTSHYFPQLIAYAGALLQADSDAETFDLALIFTDSGETRHLRLSRGDVLEILEWADEPLKP